MSYIKRQGDLHEKAAERTIGGDAYNLNKAAAKGMVGHQYPTYDISSSTEIASVKSHISQLGECPAKDVKAYKADFSHMLGWNRAYDHGKSPLEQDAERIQSLSKQGFTVPTDLKGANMEQTLEYVQNKTTMRIPDDHVQAVRDSLRGDIQQLPGNYYLPDNPSEEQIQSVLNRIQPSGMTSSQTFEAMAQQESAGEAEKSVGDQATTIRRADAENTQAAEVGEDAEATSPGPAGSDKQVSAEDTPSSEVKGEDAKGTSEGQDYQYGHGY